jgi:hypothetical protein
MRQVGYQRPVVRARIRNHRRKPQRHAAGADGRTRHGLLRDDVAVAFDLEVEMAAAGQREGAP